MCDSGVRELAKADQERLKRAGEAYQTRRRKADERRLEETDRALGQLATVLLQLRDAGYSMGDLGRTLGMSRQGVYDLLKRAETPRLAAILPTARLHL
jgi:hypothetical protein